jgi:aryl-alcohol dehydrogenase-like predicted oxidoreductase
MSYGAPDRGRHPWTLDEATSRPFIRRAVELGINFFDTANAYSEGTSEEIVGRALHEYADRDEIVIATKVFFPTAQGRNLAGLSRKSIFANIDASLRRLGTDYVDLYQIHRWDYATPIEETMEALHDVVKAGKARYIGASSMYAWQFAKALHVAERNGWTRFVSMQDHYNLLNREEEREMHPFCADQRIGVIPWSPLARGRLTRDWNEQTERSRTDDLFGPLYATTVESDRGGQPRRRAGAGGTRLDAVQGRHLGAHHRSNADGAPGGCSRRPVSAARARRDRGPRGALRAPSGGRFPVIPTPPQSIRPPQPEESVA